MAGSPRSNLRLQTVVVVAGAVLLAIKFTAWSLTHSNTILSDALESIVNVTAGTFALYSLWLAAQPRDREHPYGHGKIEYISAGVEGSLVMVAGGLIIWRAIEGLLSHQRLHDLGVGIALTGGAGALNLLMGLALERRGRRTRSLTMEASGAHLLSDAWSTVAMLVGLVTIRITGILWLDQAFAIAFALYIVYTGVRVVRRAVAGIMDQADDDQAATVIATLEAHRRPPWIDVHNFRTIKYGDVLHVDCHVTLPWYYTLAQAHQEIAALERLVNRDDHQVELFIHMDPCVPPSCRICTVDGCAERTAPLAARIPWSLDSVLADARHRAATDDEPARD